MTINYTDDGLFICKRQTYHKENGGGYIYEEIKPYIKIDPDMSADQIRLHFGELTADEIRLVRSAIRFAQGE